MVLFLKTILLQFVTLDRKKSSLFSVRCFFIKQKDSSTILKHWATSNTNSVSSINMVWTKNKNWWKFETFLLFIKITSERSNHCSYLNLCSSFGLQYSDVTFHGSDSHCNYAYMNTIWFLYSSDESISCLTITIDLITDQNLHEIGWKQPRKKTCLKNCFQILDYFWIQRESVFSVIASSPNPNRWWWKRILMKSNHYTAGLV